ncbi:hypothetical protein FRX31_012960 [Thalictrum thalictroides]|uniref:Uncharacterized protein n=1 Tax=Thalictrum thalictroides TaxID=46969 RepID=A0A7J6WKJ3_THATH|nr:hypothetical protein FRX31_012960 [Thalictrum thalictroides]
MGDLLGGMLMPLKPHTVERLQWLSEDNIGAYMSRIVTLISNFKLAYTKLEIRPSFFQLQQPLSSDVVVPILIILHLQVLLKFPNYIMFPMHLKRWWFKSTKIIDAHFY